MSRSLAKALAAFTLAAPVARAQTLDSTIARAVREEMAATHAPGAAVAIVRDGKVVYAAGFGSASAEGGQPVTPGTLFRIGSITKALTGIAALQLRESGALRFDAPVGTVARDLHASLGARTMAQLLTHTAGMANAGSADGSHDDDALAARVRTWGAEQIIGPPNDLYSYSSTGYWLAAYVMEQATGAHYADLMTTHVFTPLGMTRSTLRPLMALTYPLALDHRVGPDGVARVLRPYADDASTWAGGSVFSSVEELARVAVALLDSGRVDGKRALPASVVTAMRTPQASEGDGPCAYTFGLSRCERSDGVVTLGHYGFRSGSGAVFTLLPEQRAAVIILSNRNGGIFGRTERTALELLAGRALAAEATPARPRGTGRVSDFVGNYVSAGDTLRIARKGDGLVFRYGGSEQPMLVVDERTVAIVDAEGRPQGEFELVRGKQSGATYLHDGISAFRRVSP